MAPRSGARAFRSLGHVEWLAQKGVACESTDEGGTKAVLDCLGGRGRTGATATLTRLRIWQQALPGGGTVWNLPIEEF